MRYNNIIYNDTSNGKGMRISFFCQGCSLHCKNCFNTELQDFKKGKPFTKEILEEALSVFNMYQKGYDGITLIGGECMDNLEFGITVASEFKRMFPDKNIWIYSGYTYTEIIQDPNKLKLLKLCDVLVDGRFMDELKDVKIPFRGSRNQRIIDIQKSLKSKEVIEYKL